MRDMGYPGVVRHDDDRLSELLVEATEQIEHLLSSLRVELPGWLVRQEERRGVREGHSDGGPLVLAAPQPVRAGACTLGRAPEFGQPLPAFCPDPRGPLRAPRSSV